jgi:hypothetical protein
MGILGNGSSLVENLVPSGLATAASRLVEALKINSISEKIRRGRPCIVKRRNLHSEQLADLANLYFRMANVPIRFWSKVEDWRRWEVSCFQMLNGSRFKAFTCGASTVCLEKLPGESLWDHMNRGTLTRHMLGAAASEFRRAHQFWSEKLEGRWSHGDATTTNVIYNAKDDCARLIDFEIVHEKSLSTASRQADDLLVFLLDMVGFIPNRQWLPFAISFLKAYGDPEVIAELRKQLLLPGGLAWIWWGVRTNFTKPAKVKQRLAKVRGAIKELALHGPAAAARSRHKRRPSMSCQQSSPGIPKASSRTRAIKDKAKAAFPGMPSRLPTTT